MVRVERVGNNGRSVIEIALRCLRGTKKLGRKTIFSRYLVAMDYGLMDFMKVGR